MMMAGARRFVWNWALARRKEHYAATGKSLQPKDLCKELTDLKRKPETAWLKGCNAQALQQPIADLYVAYNNFFARIARFPRFKSKKVDKPRFRIPQEVKVADGRVYMPKLGWVAIRQSQDVPEPTQSATFSRNAFGFWFVTLPVKFEMPDTPLVPANPDGVVGVDLGLKEFAVLSNGERVASPRFLRKASRMLRRAQQELSRRKKDSKRRQKSRIKVARIQERTANQRSDFLHKLTTGLVHKYDGICIEDLNVKGLARTKLAKSVHDAAWGEFRRQLEYKSIWHRRHLAVVGRFYPSSKTCGVCGAIYPNLTLADRTWTCPACHTTHDRDLNAACNIRAEGLKQMKVAVGHTETENARGESVRPGAIQATLVEVRTAHRGTYAHYGRRGCHVKT